MFGNLHLLGTPLWGMSFFPSHIHWTYLGGNNTCNLILINWAGEGGAISVKKMIKKVKIERHKKNKVKNKTPSYYPLNKFTRKSLGWQKIDINKSLNYPF